MAFKKYIATKDTTITNLFIGDEESTSRVTGSNTGQSDTLEVFSIYNRVSSSTSGPSSELSRVLIEFPVSTIKADRLAQTLPASGSVSFMLKLYNQPHTAASPTGYDIEVLPLSGAWEEGYGIDHKSYSDVTKDRTGANWMRANGTDASSSATLVIPGMPADDGSNLATMEGQQFTLTDAEGTSQAFTISFGLSDVTNGNVGFGLNAGGENNTAQAIAQIKAAINNISGLNITATTITQAGDSESQQSLLLTQTTSGYAGDKTIDVSGVTNLNVSGTVSAFTGGSGTWANVGAGDIAIKGGTAVSGLPQTQSTGSQHLEIDITSFVESWIAEDYINYGLLVKITDEFEALNTVATSVETQNTAGVAASFYTKKFYSRTSDQVFYRPAIEAQWNDSKGDDRANFYYSSSLAPAADNLNKLFLNNKIRGRYADIPSTTIGSNNMRVAFFTSSAGVPDTGNLTVVDAEGGNVAYVTGSKTETGIYSCSVALPSGAYGTIYDVWYTGSAAPYTILHRGQITPKTFSGDDYYNNTKYIFKVTSGKLDYNINDSQRIRLYTRSKNITPNIFTVSQNTTDVTIIPEIFYRVIRTYDDFEVIPFGTGSSNHTKLSYDASGSYFDFDFSNLQQNFEYKFEFAYYEDYASDHIVHPYSFKFRTSE